ncbi:heavy metal translocating P-type ATPase [Aequorivita sp. F47161]|uniref:P-type Zn(2+) transporter n=1 Tax=Aequorivita vitellina TaxID=2874475 RepID=A0A9X1QXK9_9FLAO|nr:heavy metal translocating P-type ATPase [Aequorivita vitellina]MCG2419227.1 heavy metal translocating P-type ATPase [Aequorivita vitellina]
MNKLKVEIEQSLHTREARRIENSLKRNAGVSYASVSNSGVMFVEWDGDQTVQSAIVKCIAKQGLTIVNIQNTNGADDLKEGDHNHFKLTILGENTELYFAVISGVFWVSGIVLSFIAGVADILVTILFIIGALFGGVFTLFSAAKDLFRGKFEIDFLMLFAAIGAAALGKWGESALLLFLFSLGHALEHYAMKRARKSISALSDLTPPKALVKQENGELKEVYIEELKVGDIIVVKPNSTIAADGVVAKGSSPVNQASITGESMPVTKHSHDDWQSEIDITKLLPEHRVFAGTINGNGALEIKVLKEAKDSTLSRLIYLVKEAETQKSPTQHLTDRFEKYYVPTVLIFVLLLLFAFVVLDETFEQSFYRAMSVLIAASPCALAISTPSAVLAGIARAARKGVLIKGGRPLEDLGSVSAIAFDKTGTLTEGRPTLTNAIPFGATTKEQLLKVSVAVEGLSDHPLAAAIVEGGRKELGDVEIPKAENLKALTARGIQADWNGGVVHIGNRRLFEELTGKPVPTEIDQQMAALESDGHTAMIVHQKAEYLGVISAMDVARPEAISTLENLKKIGIKRMVMLTGDNQLVANAIAKNIGITDPLGSLLPEDKVTAIEKLKAEENGVAMVGDGVNDAPAMAKSTVGIAMGAAGSDVALETADIALMADKLDNLPFAIGLSRKAKSIIKQNLIISLGMVAILVPLTLLGTIAIGPAVVFHEGSTLVVVLNALRLLRYNA